MDNVLAALVGVTAVIGSGIMLLWLSGAAALQWYETEGYRIDTYYHGE